MNKDYPKCADCVHYVNSGLARINKICRRKVKNDFYDIVTGEARTRGELLSCYEERNTIFPITFKCGKKGRFFSPKSGVGE